MKLSFLTAASLFFCSTNLVFAQCPNITANQNGGTFGGTKLTFTLSETYWSNCSPNTINVAYNYATSTFCENSPWSQATGASNCAGSGKEKLEYKGCDNSYCSEVGTGAVLDEIVITITQTTTGGVVVRQEICTYVVSNDNPSTDPNSADYCNYILPVELVYFKGASNFGKVDLAWETASEENNSHFIVERSTDGVVFLNLDQVKGAGSSLEARHYAYQDFPEYQANGYYYRLKQVDFDGTYAYSKVVHVSTESSPAMTCYPNPVGSGSEINISMGASWVQEPLPNISIIDISGKEWVNKALNTSDAGTSLALPSHQLPYGVYRVLLRSANRILTQQPLLIIKE